MRPDRLEVEGFTAFRDKAVVDFNGADLFAFVGPTGSGKSSLVDAILFALYGVVPRLGKATVEPVISLGRNEARIRFDFTVGEQAYTAARVVRRTKSGGATTAEARLEGGPETIMGADEVTEAVEAVLGLGFDHFTKCVVLPQGQFAAFLQDPAAKRQELLRQLLDLGRYRRVRELAVERQRLAEARVEVVDQQMAELEFATDKAVEVATAVRDQLIALVTDIEKAEEEREVVAVEMREAFDQARKTGQQARLVHGIAKPSNLEQLSKAYEEAAKILEAARKADGLAAQQLALHEQAAVGMKDTEALTRLAEQWSRLAAETEAEAQALIAVEQANATVEEARRHAADADEVASRAIESLEAARREHAAHALAAHLEQGQPCPVCRQTVGTLPADDDVPPVLSESEKQVERARRTAKEASSALVVRNENLVATRSRYDELVKRVRGLTEGLAGQPAAEEVAQLLDQRRRLDLDINGARNAVASTRRELDEAVESLNRVERDIDEARKEFDRARDRVAALNPPPAQRDDLAADWNTLEDWARTTGTELTESATNLEKATDKAKEQLARIEQAMIEKLHAAGVEPQDGRRPRDLCADALAAARQEVTRLEAARTKSAELAEKRTVHHEAGQVAKTLARHLAANGFEGWLMAEALEALIDGANQRLGDLSDGAFSLELDRRDFRVIDHRNADERRSVKTLSGGETFLVSLALALALAEQLASMSVHGVARLESMFLDEGFGTLDSETLDTVATVIHELGSDGRTIGLITHVKDLAEQVPTRFEVSKGPSGATVERVDA